MKSGELAISKVGSDNLNKQISELKKAAIVNKKSRGGPSNQRGTNQLSSKAGYI